MKSLRNKNEVMELLTDEQLWFMLGCLQSFLKNTVGPDFAANKRIIEADYTQFMSLPGIDEEASKLLIGVNVIYKAHGDDRQFIESEITGGVRYLDDAEFRIGQHMVNVKICSSTPHFVNN